MWGHLFHTNKERATSKSSTTTYLCELYLRLAKGSSKTFKPV